MGLLVTDLAIFQFLLLDQTTRFAGCLRSRGMGRLYYRALIVRHARAVVESKNWASGIFCGRPGAGEDKTGAKAQRLAGG